MSGCRLLLDASAPQSIIALAVGLEVCAVRTHDVPRRHAEVLGEHIAAVLEEAERSFSDLDEVVVGHGPGSFIGIRVALSTALGIATARQIPISAVCSVLALAEAAPPSGATLYVLDARKSELYVRVVHHDGSNFSDEEGPRAVAPHDLSAYLERRGATKLTRIVGAAELVPPDIVAPRIVRRGASAAGLLLAHAGDAFTQRSGPIVARYCRAPDARLPVAPPPRT